MRAAPGRAGAVPRTPARARRGPLRAVARWVALWAVLTALGAPAGATTYLQLTPEQMLAKASLVFVGTVSQIATVDQDGMPWTRVTFTVVTPLKGIAATPSGKPVELDFLGGSVAGGPSLTVGGMPTFQSGEKVLVFAYDQRYASPIVGFRQGLWRVVPQGLEGLDGKMLSVSADGKLASGGEGSSLDAVVAAIQKTLGAAGGTP